jgi:hypothetical protein
MTKVGTQGQEVDEDEDDEEEKEDGDEEGLNLANPAPDSQPANVTEPAPPHPTGGRFQTPDFHSAI